MVSFSQDIKLEILEQKPLFRHYKKYIAFGFVSAVQYCTLDKIAIDTQLPELMELFADCVETFVRPGIQVAEYEDNNNYLAWVVHHDDRAEILEHLQDIKYIPTELPAWYAYFAGVFLACGNMTDPTKNYHLEMVCNQKEFAEFLNHSIAPLLEGFRLLARRKQWVLYCKNSKQIQDFLTMIGATKASLDMVEIEIFKSMRNQTNRVANCDMANIDKTISAAMKQVEDITLVLEQKREALTPALLETALLRLEHPAASLSDLAQLSHTNITRSGLNYRLQSLCKMAERLRTTGKGDSNG